MKFTKSLIQGKICTRRRSKTWLRMVLLFAAFSFASSSHAATPVMGGDFEYPVLAKGQFKYRPLPFMFWTYAGGSGVSTNNSGFTNGNPPAPEGNQVLFLQKFGSVSKTLNLSAGAYRFSFKAAQRGNFGQSQQTFTIKINNQLIGTFTPNGITYEDYQTEVVYLSTGNHQLELRGINPQGGDNTAFVDDLQYTKGQLWSDPSSWPSQTIPGLNTAVVIPSGSLYVLDTNADIKNLTIHGTLVADQNEDLNLSANWILVHGNDALLQWGTETDPYLNRAIITLKHAPNDVVPGPWMKFLAARAGGQVEIHGANKLGWTQLNVTANKTASSITLKENPNWNMGDQIVIASTDFDPHQAEVRTIMGVTNGGLTLDLDAPLDFMHWGQLKNYDGVNHELDERAEVGLLSRNITIQGDAQSETTGIGGHTMFMPSSKVRFSGVELYRMGQMDSLARYPFHWHLAGDVSGQYIKDCSIHRSYNRVVTVHGTNYALVEGNVGYDHIGHGYFLEDGDEIRNTFRRNLGILTRIPPDGVGVTPHDYVIDATTTLVKLPATFWITNPDNYFVENVAAGSEGSGFWMVAQDSTLGDAPQISPPPGERDLLQFDDNRAHSTSFSNFSIDGRIKRSTNTFGSGTYKPFNPDGSPIKPRVNGFVGYKTRQRNVWMRANTIEFWDCTLADSPRNTFFAFNQILHNSLIVGKSPNIGNPISPNEITAGRTLAFPYKAINNKLNLFQGHTIYDGPSILFDVHLADFYGTNASAFTTNGAAFKSTVHQATGITFENVDWDRRVKFGRSSWLETFYASGLIDNDGSITGLPNPPHHITPRIAPKNGADTKIREEGFNIEPGAILRSEWKAYINPTQQYFSALRLTNSWTSANMHPTYNIRSDGPATYGQQAPSVHNHNPVIMNDINLKYYWQYHKFPNIIRPRIKYANENDFVISVFPNMPSSPYVYKDITGTSLMTRAFSLNQMLNSDVQSYYFIDNTLYVKQIANTLGNVAHSGEDFKYIAPEFRICQFQNCAQASGNTVDVTFADFELRGDTRAVPGSSGSLPTPVLGVNDNNPNDLGITWSMTKNENAVDEHTQVRFEFPRQVWTDFNYMIVNLTGVSKFKIHIHDTSQGVKSLGTFSSGNQVVIPLNPATNKDFLDEVYKLVVRVKESHMGATLTSTINLFDIKLSLTMPNNIDKVTVPIEPTLASANVEGVKIFPNPSRDAFQLSMDFASDDELQLEVFDLQGRKQGEYQQQVSRGPWQEEFRHEQFGLHPGVYQLRLRTQVHGTQILRLLIQD